jgi:uncharacterized protein
MTGNRLVAWIGPDPDRIDVAHLQLAPDRLSAHGTSTTAAYALAFRLRTDSRWVTRQLDVRVDGDGWWRALTLHRDDRGDWTSRHLDASDGDDPRGTDRHHPELSGALDCDLALCPVTNTMPVLREGLIDASRRGEPRRAELTMAWVSVPELDVVASVQRYESGVAVAGGGAQIRFQSGSFVEHVEFDGDGVVVSYPSIGRLVVHGPSSIATRRNAG